MNEHSDTLKLIKNSLRKDAMLAWETHMETSNGHSELHCENTMAVPVTSSFSAQSGFRMAQVPSCHLCWGRKWVPGRTQTAHPSCSLPFLLAHLLRRKDRFQKLSGLSVPLYLFHLQLTTATLPWTLGKPCTCLWVTPNTSRVALCPRFCAECFPTDTVDMPESEHRQQHIMSVPSNLRHRVRSCFVLEDVSRPLVSNWPNLAAASYNPNDYNFRKRSQWKPRCLCVFS